MHTAAALAALSLLTSTALAQTPSLTLFQPDSGAIGTSLRDLSRGSGRVLAFNFQQPVGQFTWTPTEGRRAYSTLGALGVSSDGRSFVGGLNGTLAVDRAGVTQSIGTPAGRTLDTDTFNLWVGDNGGYAIGNFQSGTDRKPFKWTQADGWQQIGGPSLLVTRVRDVTPDGNAMIGLAQDFNDGFHYLYREGQGFTNLGTLQASGLNDDGTRVVGSRTFGPTVATVAVVWNNGVQTDLPTPAGFASATCIDLTNDGSMIVGQLTFPGFMSTTGFVWTPDRGTRTITDFAAEYGIIFPAHTLLTDIRVSSDGRTIAGSIEGFNFANTFALTIPSPSTAIIAGVALFAANRRRR